VHNFIGVIETGSQRVRLGIVLGNRLDRPPSSKGKVDRAQGNLFDGQIGSPGKEQPEDEPFLS
jgi:hypothetical protein